MSLYTLREYPPAAYIEGTAPSAKNFDTTTLGSNFVCTSCNP